MKLGINNADQLKNALLAPCAGIDMDEMVRDVKPFLFSPRYVNKVLLFPDFIRQQKLQDWPGFWKLPDFLFIRSF